MRDQVGDMVLSQQALQTHVDRLDTGLASVVAAQHAATASTNALGAQIQQLPGHITQGPPCMPPGQGGPQGSAQAEMPMAPQASAEVQPSTAAGTADGAAMLAPPTKSAGKGLQEGAGTAAPY